MPLLRFVRCSSGVGSCSRGGADGTKENWPLLGVPTTFLSPRISLVDPVIVFEWWYGTVVPFSKSRIRSWTVVGDAMQQSIAALTLSDRSHIPISGLIDDTFVDARDTPADDDVSPSLSSLSLLQSLALLGAIPDATIQLLSNRRFRPREVFATLGGAGGPPPLLVIVVAVLVVVVVVVVVVVGMMILRCAKHGTIFDVRGWLFEVRGPSVAGLCSKVRQLLVRLLVVGCWSFLDSHPIVHSWC